MAQRKETASSEAKRGLTRRDALKGAAVAGLGILGAGALPGCAPQGGEGAQPGQQAAGADATAWDKEVDVLVAGTGTAIHAAVACSEFGSGSILIVEKDPAMFGGTSATSGGGYALALLDFNAEEGIGDTREQVLEQHEAGG